MLEINGQIYDFEVETGKNYDYISYKTQKEIIIKKFWASTA